MTLYFVSPHAEDEVFRFEGATDSGWFSTLTDATKMAQSLADEQGTPFYAYAVELAHVRKPTRQPDLDLTGYKLWSGTYFDNGPPSGVRPDDYVSVILRDGNVRSPEKASIYEWSVDNGDPSLSDIIAYRVVEDWERAKEDFVPHYGNLAGDFPKGVGENTLVNVRFRTYEPTYLGVPARALNWSIDPAVADDGDIIAYQITG